MIFSSDKCSLAYISNACGIFSGFSDTMGIKLSWEQQIISNYQGRMNFKIRNITTECQDTYPIEQLLKIWIMEDENIKIKNHVLKILNKKKKIVTLDNIVYEYMNTKQCVKLRKTIYETFQEKVLAEMMTESKRDKKYFSLFCRYSRTYIMTEMEKEFCIHISTEEFGIYIRKAILLYEG